MALPTASDQLNLETAWDNGMPTVRVGASSSVVADGIHFTDNGYPFFAVSPAGSAPSYNASQFMIIF